MNEPTPTVNENIEVVAPQAKKFPIKTVLLILIHLIVVVGLGYFVWRYMAISQLNKANEQKLTTCSAVESPKVDWISYKDMYLTGLLLWSVDHPPRIECANLHWESSSEMSTDSKVTRINYNLFDPVSDETLMFVSIYYNETAANAYRNTSESGMSGNFSPLTNTTFNGYNAYTTNSDSGAHIIYIQRGNDLVTITTWSSDISKEMLKSFKFVQ